MLSSALTGCAKPVLVSEGSLRLVALNPLIISSVVCSFALYFTNGSWSCDSRVTWKHCSKTEKYPRGTLTEAPILRHISGFLCSLKCDWIFPLEQAQVSHWAAQSPSIHLSHFGDHTNAFGVGTQGLFAQESGAEAFFFKKPCSPRACLFLLLVRVTVGHSCFVGHEVFKLFWELVFHVFFHSTGLHLFSWLD